MFDYETHIERMQGKFISNHKIVQCIKIVISQKSNYRKHILKWMKTL